jgi:hypothetical protein
MNRIAVVLVLLVPLLGGCDQLKERMGMTDPAKVEAEGKAVGAACRNAGQGLEDCYRMNPDTGKAAVYAGWKEMNEYMTKNNMQVIPPNPSANPADAAPASPPAANAAKDNAAGSDASGAAAKDAKPANDAKPADKPAKTKDGKAEPDKAAQGH